jgi:hypothetical protein
MARLADLRPHHSGRFEAYCRIDYDPITARLLIAQRGYDSDLVLFEDGRWREVDQNASPMPVEIDGERIEPGILLPNPALAAIAEAIERAQGKRTSDAESVGEARVLREALGHERGRVDLMLERLLTNAVWNPASNLVGPSTLPLDEQPF